jgi:hypothetical protein
MVSPGHAQLFTVLAAPPQFNTLSGGGRDPPEIRVSVSFDKTSFLLFLFILASLRRNDIGSGNSAAPGSPLRLQAPLEAPRTQSIAKAREDGASTQAPAFPRER